MMADASASMTPYVLKSIVTAVFSIAAPGWAETRRDAWSGLYNVSETTIEIDEVEFAVYVADQQWMTELYTCRLSGGCQYPVERCLQFNFYNQPSS